MRSRMKLVVDSGGKSQGVAPYPQFETEPRSATRWIHVERDDGHEGIADSVKKGPTVRRLVGKS